MTNSEDRISVSHSGQGDVVLGNKIGRQINQGAGSTYIENQVVHNGTDATLPKKKSVILFLSASAQASARLNVEAELQAIREQLQLGGARDCFELQQEMGVRITDWVRAMGRRPRIVHFAGHGGQDGIEIISQDGYSPELVGADALKRIFRNKDKAIEVVVLNACYSAAQAKIISAQCIYFVGFSRCIADGAGIEFARGLYIGIGEGKNFEESFNGAMIVLETRYPEYADAVVVWKDGIQLAL